MDSSSEVMLNKIVFEQCGVVASKGNQILGLIRKNITYCFIQFI